MTELRFSSDTKHRRGFFTGVSFSHPAKMMLPLQLWLYENFTKKGDTILDCMAGSGTALVGCSMGMNVICVELESKFIEIIKGNWEKIKERGPMLGCEMGEATILQGDARNLELVLSGVEGGLLADAVITSPPYAEAGRQLGKIPLDALRTNPRRKGEKLQWTDYANYESPGNISELPYGEVDSIITSPPYTSGGHHADQTGTWGGQAQSLTQEQANYGQSDGQIGNLKETSYLEAMYQVYFQCFKVLKDGGLMILVVKNFLRQGKEIPLDADTISLCEKCGFTLIERHHRLLTQLSFWRIIHAQKYPDHPVINKEHILVFHKT